MSAFKYGEIKIALSGEPASGKSHLLEVLTKYLAQKGIQFKTTESEHTIVIPTQVVSE